MTLVYRCVAVPIISLALCSCAAKPNAERQNSHSLDAASVRRTDDEVTQELLRRAKEKDPTVLLLGESEDEREAKSSDPKVQRRVTLAKLARTKWNDGQANELISTIKRLPTDAIRSRDVAETLRSLVKGETLKGMSKIVRIRTRAFAIDVIGELASKEPSPYAAIQWLLCDALQPQKEVALATEEACPHDVRIHAVSAVVKIANAKMLNENAGEYCAALVKCVEQHVELAGQRQSWAHVQVTPRAVIDAALVALEVIGSAIPDEQVSRLTSVARRLRHRELRLAITATLRKIAPKAWGSDPLHRGKRLSVWLSELAALGIDDKMACRETVYAINEMKGVRDAAVQPLIELARRFEKDRDYSLHLEIVNCLGRIGDGAEGAVPFLSELLRDKRLMGKRDKITGIYSGAKYDLDLRRNAADALSRIQARADIAVPALQYALFRRDLRGEGESHLAEFHGTVAHALGAYGADAAQAVPDLLRSFVEKGNGRVLDAIRSIGIADPKVVSKLEELQADSAYRAHEEKIGELLKYLASRQ